MSPRVALLAIVAILSPLCLSVRADDTPSVSERIDQLIEASAIGPVAPIASDADFVRRIYLDLVGVIPSATQTRAFLSDTSPTKRADLIDQLLETPQFARHMALTFDVVLMERRPDRAVKSTEWFEYLRSAFAQNRPLDALLRELITADGADEAARPAARFLLDRECEPNLITRDAGRVLFGMDLQCAQCHDHPNVNDYLQEDYYGLYSFFLRTSSFTDPKKKQAFTSEKADGEANFKSVFTGNSADRVAPQLPHGKTLYNEPTFKSGEEYVSIPTKETRAIPKHSRRARLAESLTSSWEFRRNLANRLWAHLMGRGLVHPVDSHHLDNPPTHPEVLELLATEIETSGYNIQTMLRTIALTRAYQRTCDPVAEASVMGTVTPELLASLERDRGILEAQHKGLDETFRQAQAERKRLVELLEKSRAEVVALEKKKTEIVADLEKKKGAEKPAEELVAKVREQLRATTEAATKVAEAAKLLGEDKPLKDASDLVTNRAKQIETDLATAEKSLVDKQAETKGLSDQMVMLQSQIESTRNSQVSTSDLTAAEEAMLRHRHERDTIYYRLQGLKNRQSLAQRVVDFQTATESGKPAEERAAIWNDLVDRWTIANQVAPLRPLTSEQFTLSLLEGTGTLAHRRQQLQAALVAKPPDRLQQALEADRESMLETLVDEQLFEQSRGNLGAFIPLYGTLAGADFQATVNQALFFENGGAVQSLLNPVPENLVSRLMPLTEAGPVAEELYVSILSRLPSDDERHEVAAHLQDRTDDRPQALGELVWALMSTSEFRFNH